MKLLILIALTTLSFNLCAGPVEDAVKSVEDQYDVQCIQSTKPIFSKCFGYPQSCFYNINFKCISDTNQFKLKVKVGESYTGAIKVRKTVIKSI